MNRYDTLIARARRGEPVLIDGSTGSECLRRGAAALDHGWSGGAALSDPDIVRQIHAEYIDLGADLIASNTFATGKNVLEDAGVADDFALLNHQAVGLAIQARIEAGPPADHVVVAGGISNWSFSGNRPSLARLHENTVEQARIMRDAGADLFSLEMMVDLPRMTATLDAVTAVDLPVWVGLTVGPEEGMAESELPTPVPLTEQGLVAEAVELAKGYPSVDAFCVMHSDVRVVERAVTTVKQHWDGPIGAYAHAAQVIGDDLIFHDVISPQEYAAYEPAWHAAGASMIGGCCGIGPEHLRVLAQQLQQR